jgi:hypothetical protein
MQAPDEIAALVGEAAMALFPGADPFHEPGGH